MPKKLDKLVKDLQKQGKDESAAYAIATSVLQKSGYLKKGTNKLNRKKLGDGVNAKSS